MNALIKNTLKCARVLVVEDDPIMLALIESILNSVSIEKITKARDGIQAWRSFEEGAQYDLVICDWIMPSMSGLEVLKNIRAGRSAIPFILVTARDTEEAVKRATDCGVTAFIAKPFAPEQLVSEVVKVFQGDLLPNAEVNAEYWDF